MKPEIYIYDDIGPDWAGMISGETITKALKEIGNAPEIIVRINSPGGDCFEAFAIYNALKRHPAKIRVEIDALAASAASLVAMAGNTVRIAENGLLMIHNCWTVVQGNKSELAKTIDVLDKIDGNLQQVYASRTGMFVDEIAELMNAETWYTASQAVDEGFCDEVVRHRLVASAKIPQGRYRNTPSHLLRKVDEMRARSIAPGVAEAIRKNEAARRAHISNQQKGVESWN